MTEFQIRLIGAASLALGVVFQFTRFVAERYYWDSVNPSFSLSYSVHPYFVYGAFALQLGLQIWWLWKSSPKIQLKDDETFDVHTIVFQWKFLVPAVLILSASVLMQFYSILTINQSRSGIRDTLIAVVAKLNTAYTLLLLTETWATYEESYSPSMLQLISYGVVFLLIVALFLLHPVKMIHSSSSQVVWSGPDTVLATALIYVLAALYHGPVFNPLWHNTFYWTAAVIAVVTAISIDFLIHNVHDNEEQGQRMDLEHNQKLKISVT